MSSSSRKPSLSSRRLPEVYVELPPSPLSLSRMSGPHVLSNGNMRRTQVYVELPSKPTLGRTSLKENTPARPSHSSTLSGKSESNLTSTSRKRKLSTTTPTTNFETQSMTKKAKLDRGPSTIAKPRVGKENEITKASEQSDAAEFPNGYYYCHQCARKRDAVAGLQCTISGKKEKRCRVKFCPACLQRRYGESSAEIRAEGESLQDIESGKHVAGAGYTFECPKCRDICNCSFCRKAKGLKPTGKLTVVARKTNCASVADLLLKNPSAKAPTPKKRTKTQLPPVPAPPKTRAPKERKKVVKPRILPTWTEVASYNISLQDTEDRIQIREFVVRMVDAGLIDMPRAQLEELDEIVGSPSRAKDCEDEDDYVPWVSELAAQKLITGLLRIFLRDSSNYKLMIKSTIKKLKDVGTNLTKLWSIMAHLRERVSLKDDSDCRWSLTFPDPLSPPDTLLPIRGTRSTTGLTGIHVVHSGQLIPVILALIECALQTNIVREEIEDAVAESKDKAREKYEAVHREQEKWAKVKENTDPKDAEFKNKRAAHKQTMSDLDNGIRVAMHAFAPRFSGCLGTDKDGRTYYALTPGSMERNAAVDFIALSAGSAVKACKKLKPFVPAAEERETLMHWPWFIAVWGKKPTMDGREGVVHEGAVSEMDPADGSEAKWWGFCSPQEIRKLALWITEESGIDCTPSTSGDDSAEDDRFDIRQLSPLTDASDDDMCGYTPRTTPDRLKALVKELNEYADTLEWRIARSDDIRDVKGKDKLRDPLPVASSEFYS